MFISTRSLENGLALIVIRLARTLGNDSRPDDRSRLLASLEEMRGVGRLPRSFKLDWVRFLEWLALVQIFAKSGNFLH